MIHIYKKWYIEADRYQYTLFKKKMVVNSKTGEEYMSKTECTYHSTVSSALECLIRMLHRKNVQSQDMTLKESIEVYKRIEKVILKSAEGKTI